MGWQLIGLISLIWFGVVLHAAVKLDYTNLMVYGGIFLTNTGLMIHAFRSAQAA